MQERNSKTDWVPLHETALRGSVDCCRVLLQNHAPVRPRTQDKDTPRELAIRYNKTAIVELIGIIIRNCLVMYTTQLIYRHS